MSGFIYCFNTHENPNIIKAGHTQQDVQKRLRGYLGPTKPRSIIFTLKVDDSVEAEKMMLELMQQCVSLNKRHDLGNEWFETTGNFNFEQRTKHLQTIAKIAQKASSIPPSIPPSMPPSMPPSIPPSVPPPSVPASVPPSIKSSEYDSGRPPVQQPTGLRGLEDYFKKFDDFVAQEAKPNHVSPLELLRNYEASTFCPYGNLCKFLPYSEDIRSNVTAHRYSDFLN
uniref:Bacteriophage T5 Orf172 DNA-binding domain-containing protein n=1 Tax=viral metagenome TaxID=1070528 RepID=A0A6C0IY05_9ZZZZ